MPKIPVVMSHWGQLIENLQASPMQFYQEVEQAVSKRLIPETANSRVDYHESGILSVNREYLRVTRGAHSFDICGAPFGTGFFVSTWLVEERNSLSLVEIVAFLGGLFLLLVLLGAIIGLQAGLLSFLLLSIVAIAGTIQYLNQNREGWDDLFMTIPIVGPIYQRVVRPVTYYKVDTTMMFQQAVHAAVMEVVDAMVTAKGLRGLSELERKPVLRMAAAG